MRVQNSLCQTDPDSVFVAFSNHRKKHGTQPYPSELKTLACRLLTMGLSHTAVSRGCQIAKSTIYKWQSLQQSVPPPRKLEVVPQVENISPVVLAEPHVVRIKLPSGIKLTLKRDDITREFLQTLREVG
jgi:hypothetical protein